MDMVIFQRPAPINKVFLAVFVFAGGLLLAQSARSAPDCRTEEQTITKLETPRTATPAIWAEAYGEPEDDEVFIGGKAGGDTAAAAFITALGKRQKQGEETPTIILKGLDDRGRVLWEQSPAIKNLISVERVIARKKGLVAAGAVRGGKLRSAWLGFFDETGRMTSSKTITDPNNNLTPRDIIAVEGGGYLLAATASAPRGTMQFPVLYRLDESGRVIRRRALNTGAEAEILSLSPAAAKGHSIAGGYMRGDDGRRNGWIMALDADDTILWQRQYPRGRGATINRAVPGTAGRLMVTGETMPAGEEPAAAWVMAANDQSGDIIWQRYYQTPAATTAPDLRALADGRTLVLLAADGARLLTLDPRGNITDNLEYDFGRGAAGSRLISGTSNENIIFGSALIAVPSKDPAKESADKKETISQDAWVAVVPQVATYADLCAPKKPDAP